MRSDSRDETTTPELVAEMRAIVDETRRAIATSQAILDRCAEHPPHPEAPRPEAVEARADGPDVLGDVADGLIRAYRSAKLDGDGPTVRLIEQALFHVGRRLACSMSPAEAGLVCH